MDGCVDTPIKTKASDLVCRITDAECQAIQDKVCEPTGSQELFNEFKDLINDTLYRNYAAVKADNSGGSLPLNNEGCDPDPTIPTVMSVMADLLRIFDTLNCDLKKLNALAQILCGGDPCQVLTGNGWVNKGVRYLGVPFVPTQSFTTGIGVASYSGLGVNFSYTNTSTCRKSVTLETMHYVSTNKIAGPEGEVATCISELLSSVSGAGVFMSGDTMYFDDQGTIGLGDGLGAERVLGGTTRAIAVVDPGNTVTFTTYARVTANYGHVPTSDYTVAQTTLKEEDAI